MVQTITTTTSLPSQAHTPNVPPKKAKYKPNLGYVWGQLLNTGYVNADEAFFTNLNEFNDLIDKMHAKDLNKNAHNWTEALEIVNNIDKTYANDIFNTLYSLKEITDWSDIPQNTEREFRDFFINKYKATEKDTESIKSIFSYFKREHELIKEIAKQNIDNFKNAVKQFQENKIVRY